MVGYWEIMNSLLGFEKLVGEQYHHIIQPVCGVFLPERGSIVMFSASKTIYNYQSHKYQPNIFRSLSELTL